MSDKNKKLWNIYRKNCFKETIDDEIVELERKFRNAYILKSLEAQLAEKEADRLAHETQERLYLQLMASEQKKIAEKEENKCLTSRKQSHETYKKFLEKQIEMKKQKRQQEELIARRERKILVEVDELMDKMHEMSRKEGRNLIQAKLRREKLIFDEIREIKKVIHDEMETLKAEKEMIFCEQKAQDADKALDYQMSLIKHRQELIDKVARCFVDRTIEKHKRETAIADLLAEDIQQELTVIREHDHELIIRKQEKEKQLANDLMDQIQLSVDCEARAREQDRIFAEKVMTKVMEDESMAILTAEARKRKQIQYKEDLEKLIAERMRIRQEARMSNNDCQDVETSRRVQIKEARRRLIEQHALNVAGYLQDGIFTKDEEYIVKELLDKCRKI